MKNNSYRSYLGILYPSCLVIQYFLTVFVEHGTLKSTAGCGVLCVIFRSYFRSLWKTMASGV